METKRRGRSDARHRLGKHEGNGVVRQQSGKRKYMDGAVRHRSDKPFHREAAGSEALPSSSLPKLCLISRCNLDRMPSYNLHILDLDRASAREANKFVLSPPALRLGIGDFAGSAFCVLNSKLYIFDSVGTSIFVTDLSLIDDYAYTSAKRRLTTQSDLETDGYMLHEKRFPMATPTPDGRKILVFSSMLNHDVGAACAIDFELYDPHKKTSEKIPGIPHVSEDGFNATHYTFIDKSIFALQTEIGLYVLNLDFLHKDWKRWVDYDGPQSLPHLPQCCLPPSVSSGGQIYVVDGAICLTGDRVYDIQGENGTSMSSHVPLSLFNRCYSPSPTVLFTLLDGVKDGKCHFAVIQAAEHRKTSHSQLIVDLCSCGVIKSEHEWRPDIMVTRSIKFRLDDVPCTKYPFHLFSVC